MPQKRQAFFQRLLIDLRGNRSTDTTAAQVGRGLSLPSGFFGITYNASFEWSKPFVHLWISVGNRTESGRIFDALSEYRLELERELPDLQFDVIGQHGGWHRVSLGMTRDGYLGDSDEALDEIRDWMSESIVRLERAVQPMLEKVMEEFQKDMTREGL